MFLNYYQYRLVLLSTILFSFCMVMSSNGMETMQAGFATIDITPDDGTVFDPLTAKALVLRQGDELAALVVCDLIDVDKSEAIAIRMQVAETTDIPPNHIAISATHTHCGGKREDLADRVAQVIVQAREALRPVTVETGTTLCKGLAFNRRFLMKDGTVRFNPGYRPETKSFDGGEPYLNPEIVRAVGPADHELGIVFLRDAANHKPVGSYTNFPMHVCTAGASTYSADYPGFLAASLGKTFGRDFVSIFGTGTSGDINHWDVTKPGPQNGHQDYARPIGEKLARAVVDHVPQLCKAAPALAVRRRIVKVPLFPYTELDLAWAKQAQQDGFKGFGPVGYGYPGFLARVRASKILRLQRLWEESDIRSLEVQVFRITTNTAIVLVPGEIFVELGLAIKKASPFAHTLVVELANEDCGYVPTIKNFSEGGYEVVSTTLAPGGGEMLVKTAIELLQELKL